ncbi:MAG: endonuclease/exonuclease/phosphatase family protein [Fermentimonas sp.]
MLIANIISKRHFMVTLGLLLFLVQVNCSVLPKEYSTIPTNDTLRVASYNIRIASPPSLCPDFTCTDLQSVADAITRTKADLIGLQEVDKFTKRSGKDSHQARDLAKLTGMHFHFADAVNRSEGVQGNAILSKYPIIESNSYKLYTPEGSTGETRSLAIVKVKVGNQGVIFMTVHLDHRLDSDREYQLSQLIEHIKEYENHPVILSGDFNMQPDNQVFKLLDQQFEFATENHPFTFPAKEPKRTIDYLLLNKTAQKVFEVVDYYTMDEPYASDHLPVIIVLRFKTK